MLLGEADIYLLPIADLEDIPIAGNVSAPELWDGKCDGLLRTTPSGDIVLLETSMMEIKSWPSVYKTMRCKTLFPKTSHPNISTRSIDMESLQVVDEALLTLLTTCPPSKPDRWFGPSSKMPVVR